MRFIGIDLAWTYKNETGVCVIKEDGSVLFLDAKVYSDEALVSIIKTYSEGDVCIGVDAPLVIENLSGAREADRLLTRHKIHGHHLKLFMANRNFFEKAYGGIRGEALVKMIKGELPRAECGFIAEKGKQIMVEVFPTGVCCGLFPEIYPVKYKVKAKVPYDESRRQLVRILNRVADIEKKENRVAGIVDMLGLDKLEFDRKSHKHIEDQLDAFLSAYGLYTIYKGYAKQESFGEISDGFITIPVKE